MEDICVTHTLRTRQVEIWPGQRRIPVRSPDKVYGSGSRQELLVRDDILISCPKSTIEAKKKKNLGREVELQTHF